MRLGFSTAQIKPDIWCVCVGCVSVLVIPVRARRFFFLPERQCAHPCDASLLAGERDGRRERFEPRIREEANLRASFCLSGQGEIRRDKAEGGAS